MSAATGSNARTYIATHPWITFTLDLTRAPASLWMLLGEARSKIEHLEGSLLKPDVAEYLHMLFLAKGALATTAIEGNTLSEDQAVEAVQGRLHLPPSQEYLVHEINNIVRGFNKIKDDLAGGGSQTLSAPEIMEFNRLVLQDLPLDDGVVPGEISQHSVVVGGYRGAPREDCEFLLSELCEWLNDRIVAPSEEGHVPYAIISLIFTSLGFTRSVMEMGARRGSWS